MFFALGNKLLPHLEDGLSLLDLDRKGEGGLWRRSLNGRRPMRAYGLYIV